MYSLLYPNIQLERRGRHSCAFFENDLDKTDFSTRCETDYSTRRAPKYYRIDWEGVALPRRPSLKLADDEFFFQQIGRSDPNETRRVPETKDSQNVTGQSCEVSARKHVPVPLHIRKLEIELVQRKLPRYPSQTHIFEPMFYPLASCDLFEEEEQIDEEDAGSVQFETLEKEQEPIEKAFKVQMSFNTSSTEIEIECSDDESYPSLPIIRELKEETSLNMDESNVRTTEIEIKYFDDEYDYEEIEIEYSEDEEYHDVHEIHKQEALTQINEDDTSTTDIGIEDLKDEVDFTDESYYSESTYSEEEEMEIDNIFEELCQIKKEHSQQNIECIDEDLDASTSINESTNDIMNDAATELPRIDEQLSDVCERIDVKEIPCASIVFSREYNDDEEHEVTVGVVPPWVQGMLFQARMESRCRKIPEEHKMKLGPSLKRASLLGRATRLDEHTVEAAGRKYVKHDDAKPPSVVWVKGKETVSLPTFEGRPDFTVFKEAVALGGIKALKPKITTNYDPFLSMKAAHEEEVDVDDAAKHKMMRTKYLTDIYLHEDNRGRWSDDDDDLDSVHYESLDDVELPTDQCPVFTLETTKRSESEQKELIAQQVAEAVWERRYRLERPRAKQRIKYRCNCKYCKTSSPYQTFAYRKKWLLQKNLWNNPPVEDPIEIIDSKSTKKFSTDDANGKKDINKGSIRTASTGNLSLGGSSHLDHQTNILHAKVDGENDVSINSTNNSDIRRINSFESEGFEFNERPEEDSNDNKQSEIQEEKEEEGSQMTHTTQPVLGSSAHVEDDQIKQLQEGMTTAKKSKRSIKNGIKTMRSFFSNSSNDTKTSDSSGFARAA